MDQAPEEMNSATRPGQDEEVDGVLQQLIEDYTLLNNTVDPDLLDERRARYQKTTDKFVKHVIDMVNAPTSQLCKALGLHAHNAPAPTTTDTPTAPPEGTATAAADAPSTNAPPPAPPTPPTPVSESSAEPTETPCIADNERTSPTEVSHDSSVTNVSSTTDESLSPSPELFSVMPPVVQYELGEVAELVARGFYKPAVDIIQFYYDRMRALPTHRCFHIDYSTSATLPVAKEEIAMAAKPEIKATARYLGKVLKVYRKMYYDTHPPRFIQDNKPTPDEMGQLRSYGHIGKLYLPIWDDPKEGYGVENVYQPCWRDQIWQDEYDMALNNMQVLLQAKMTHLGQLSRPFSDYTIFGTMDPLSIVQSCVPDCSLVSSFINCARYVRRFPDSPLLRDIIYPHDEYGEPCVNPYGKYCIKLNLNGMARMVVVDDRLPFTIPDIMPTFTFSGTFEVLWVALIEKAYLKAITGSYKHHGGGGMVDMYRLCGWLPEDVDFNIAEVSADQVWERMLAGFTEGALVATFGVARELSPEEKEATKLSHRHGYAMLDMRVINSLRVCVLCNPSCAQPWIGALSQQDTSATSKAVHEAMHYDNEMIEAGAFCIEWKDAMRYFNNISLSWNPNMLFRDPVTNAPLPITRLACHGVCRCQTYFEDKPQLHIGVRQAPYCTRMHLVFTQHIRRPTVERPFIKDDLEGFIDEPVPFKEQFVCQLHVVDVTRHASVLLVDTPDAHTRQECRAGHCVCRRLAGYCDVPEARQKRIAGLMSNAEALTVTFDCPAGNSDFVVVLDRDDNAMRDPVNFTVTLHTALPQIVLPQNTNEEGNRPACGTFMHFVSPTYLPYTTTVQGRWRKSKLTDSVQKIAVPWYRLTLQQPAAFVLRMSTLLGQYCCCLAIGQCEERRTTEEQKGEEKTAAQKVMRNVYLLMQSLDLTRTGTTIDSTMAEMVDQDYDHILGDRRTWPWLGNVPVQVMRHDEAGTGKVESIGTFSMLGVQQEDEATTMLIEALRAKYPVSLTGTELRRESDGTVLPLRWEESLYTQLLTHLGPLGAMKKAKVQLVLSDEDRKCLDAFDEEEEKLFERICKIAAYLWPSTVRHTQYAPQMKQIKSELSHHSKQNTPTNRYLCALVDMMLTYSERHSKYVRPPVTLSHPLLRLPAGEYDILAFRKINEEDQPYKLTVETTQPHKLKLHKISKPI